jgi:hypothetical protein
MHEYRGGEFEGVTIVGYGLALNVTDGKATVEYNDLTGDFYEVLQDGKLSGRTQSIQLDAEQRTWLEDNKTWVKHQVEK